MRRLRRRLKRGIMLVVVIIAATYALNFFFQLGQYMPILNEPKDLDREMMLKKADGEKK
jgi:hypothetical protein